MKIKVDLNGVITDLRNLNLKENQIYRLIGINSIHASYRTRKETTESDIYKLPLEELSDVALQKYKEYLTSSLKKSVKIIGTNNQQKRIKQFISKLEQKVSRIKPECIPLDNLYFLLFNLEASDITYEDIGREIVHGKTFLSEINIY